MPAFSRLVHLILSSALLLPLVFAPEPAASADALTVVSWGGATQDAHRNAFFSPFAEENGIQLTEDSWSGEIARLQAMAGKGTPAWDVVQVSGATEALGCEEGLLERLPADLIQNEDDFIRDAIHPCGIGSSVGSMLIAFDPEKFPNKKPSRLEDFWDLANFPGPRGMRKAPGYNLEWALVADGVEPADVYEVLATEEGVDRAFRKLDEIRPAVKVWWQAYPQSIEILISGEVVMTPAPNGRVSAAMRQDGHNLGLVWDGQAQNMDYWAIVKGSANRKAAEKFIVFASRKERMKTFVEQILYGPTLKTVPDELPADVRALLPTAAENMQRAFFVDSDFWATHGEKLEARFAA